MSTGVKALIRFEDREYLNELQHVITDVVIDFKERTINMIFHIDSYSHSTDILTTSMLFGPDLGSLQVRYDEIFNAEDGPPPYYKFFGVKKVNHTLSIQNNLSPFHSVEFGFESCRLILPREEEAFQVQKLEEETTPKRKLRINKENDREERTTDDISWLDALC